MKKLHAEIVKEVIVACRKCGQKNRLYQRSQEGNYRCGSCRAVLSDPFKRPPWVWKAALAAVIALIIFGFQSWPQYQWAAFRDTVPAYERFIAKHPSSSYAASARERVRILSEDTVWKEAQGSGDIDKLRRYLQVYPDGKYAAQAKSQCAALADLQWEPLVASRSESAIRQFLKDFPETTRASEAEKRIQQLYDDYAWVREQNTIEAYKRYLERHPQSANRADIEKKIIDLEVAAIDKGDHGMLPQAEPVSSDDSNPYAEVTLENGTAYELTVRYSGPDSQKVVIPAGATKSLSLKVGTYTVAASVSASNVSNFAGVETMRGGLYKSRFYIQTGSTPSFGSSFGYPK